METGEENKDGVVKLEKIEKCEKNERIIYKYILPDELDGVIKCLRNKVWLSYFLNI